MTSLLAYEAVLIELNKVGAPTLLLRDFNYTINKAINNYLNKRYNIYDVNQQTTDDLSRLKTSGVFTVVKTEQPNIDDYNLFFDSESTYEVVLPSDYFHILNCICLYKAKNLDKCVAPGSYVKAKATRLTADLYPLIIDNYWNRPTYKTPYYYIHNVNTSEIVPTNEFKTKDPKYNIQHSGTDVDPDKYDFCLFDNDNTNYKFEYLGLMKLKWQGLYYHVFFNADSRNIIFSKDRHPKSLDDLTILMYSSSPYLYYTISNCMRSSETYTPTIEGTLPDFYKSFENFSQIPRTIKLGYNKHSLVEKEAGNRYGNVSEVRMEIRYGDDSTYELVKVLVDYLKTPQYVELTQEQLDTVEDTSQMLEFPDYVCQEIINELVHIIMENNSDPRLQTHPIVTLSIANPVQQLTTQPAASAAQ